MNAFGKWSIDRSIVLR